MSAIHLFSTHKVRLEGGMVMLESGDIDSPFLRRLSSYIKQDQSLCSYLHIFHHELTPTVDGGVGRTWYVDGKLVIIKDWLIDDHSRLVPYPRKANPDPEDILEDFIRLLNLKGLHDPQYCFPTYPSTMGSSGSNADFFDPLDPARQWPQVEDSADHLNVTADGTVDRFLAKRVTDPDQRDTMAVFVHAGAGYHSFQNEHVHLSICAKAASHAMRCLKAGGLSTSAVAVALKLLEDNDITNAGIGSNLTVDGRVECDATIVDHFGRSGACGAVPNIKNPILLAKLILDTSLNSLTLRRVPPNMLIGEGAKSFAAEHGMVIVSNKDLVSKNAADRFKKWREDLRRAEARDNGLKSQKSTGQITPPDEAFRTNPSLVTNTAQLSTHIKASQGLLRDHSSAVLTGMWNEGQPDSPSAEPSSPGGFDLNPVTPNKRSPFSASQNGPQTPKYPRGGFDAASSQVRDYDSSDESAEQLPAKRRKTLEDKPVGPMDGVREDMDSQWGWVGKGQASQWIAGLEYPKVNNKIDATELTAEPAGVDPDLITDTIGVIAIDGQGNIAAGSSSGGIGMKHSGRVGPAALVGIGTSVIPRDEADEDERTVATVTSGTGEHMATTMAAHKCAERLYHMTSRARGGGDNVDMCSEGEVMEDFVVEDFMGHPGVRNQASARAIGVLAVKMTAGGIYMHWAHNTESFALAHMASYHQEPKCVMSRLVPGTKVNVGAQKIYKDHARAKKYSAN